MNIEHSCPNDSFRRGKLSIEHLRFGNVPEGTLLKKMLNFQCSMLNVQKKARRIPGALLVLLKKILTISLTYYHVV